MANKLYEESSVQAIADAIREKNGTNTTYKVSEMGDAIRSIVGGNGNIPTYHYVEAFNIAQIVDEFKYDHPNRFTFGCISDNHVFNGDATYEELSKVSVLHGAFGLETVGAMASVDFVANLGDNCWENGSHTDNAYQGSLYTVNVTKPFHERLTSFSLVGNHDKNDSTQTIYDLIGQYNDFDVWATTRIRSFGYKDFTSKKVRVIALNTCDYLNHSGGCGMSYEQKDFLMRALDLSGKSNASQWQILLLSHIPLDWNGGDYNFYTDLQAILIAYEKGTTVNIAVNSAYARNETPSGYATYINGKLIYDYSGKNVAKIIANIHGHVHTDVVGKLANTNIVRMATPNTCFYLGKTESYPEYGDYSIDTAISRTANTVTDTSATFYCIDLTNRIIESYSFGAGKDRLVSYSTTSYVITYNLTNVASSNSASGATEGDVYQTTLSIGSGYTMGNVTVTMGGADITSTTYNSSTGMITIHEVTGDIVITATAAIVKSYTNMIDTAGTEDNVRLRSGGATASASGFASGYFPCKAGDVVRVYFPNGNRASIPSNGVYICLYSDTKGTLVAAYNTGQPQITNETTNGYTVNVPSSLSGITHAKVAGGPNGGYTGWIVTVNEEIK